MRLLLICLGGAIGTGARYLTSLWALEAFGVAFRFGTLIFNGVRLFLVSFIVETAGMTNAISPDVRLMLTAGVMGGFTTYSAFNFETTAYLRMGAWGTAVANIGVTLVGCLAAGFAGVALAKVLFGRESGPVIPNPPEGAKRRSTVRNPRLKPRAVISGYQPGIPHRALPLRGAAGFGMTARLSPS